MRKIFLSSVIFLAFCAPKETKKAYVNELSGIQLQRNKPAGSWPDKTEFVQAPFGSVIEVIVDSETNFGDYRDPWLRAKFQNQTLWVSNKDLSFSGVSKFYMIVSTDGLNLRQTASTSASIITVIPFETKGPILDVKTSVVEIQERRGFWVKIDYNGKQGWVFSGFVLTGNSKEDLKIEKASLKAEPIPLKVSEKPPSTSKKTSDNLVYTFTKRAPECYDSLAHKLEQLVIAYEQKFYSVEAERELIIKTDPEIARHLVTEAHFCLCCCGNTGNLVYLFPKDQGPLAYRFQLEKYEGFCSSEGPSTSNETRLSGDRQRIYIFKKMPICQGTYAKDDGPDGIIKKVDYISGVFKIIDLNTDSIQQIDTLIIPKMYAEEWEKAALLKARK